MNFRDPQQPRHPVLARQENAIQRDPEQVKRRQTKIVRRQELSANLTTFEPRLYPPVIPLSGPNPTLFPYADFSGIHV